MRRFFRTPFFSALVGGAVVAAFGWVAIAAGWIDTRRDPMDMYYATTIARNLGMNDAAVRVAVRLFETKGAVGSYRGLVTATIAQLGTKEHIPVLERVMADNTVLTTIRRSVVKDGKPVVEVVAEIQSAVDDANKAVSKAEAIRKFEILSEDWTEEGGQMTPSLKLKRSVVMKQYADAVEGLYAGSKE